VLVLTAPQPLMRLPQRPFERRDLAGDEESGGRDPDQIPVRIGANIIIC